MKILITGGAGYIGSAVVRYLLSLGHKVTALDSLLYGGEGLISVANKPNFSFIEKDVRGVNRTNLPERYDFVVHLAGLVGPICDEDQLAAEAVNSYSIYRLSEVGEKVLYFSTCSVYGKVGRNKQAVEGTPLSPLNWYAATKLNGEKAAFQCGASVFRCATVCGLSDRTRLDLLINEAAFFAAKKIPITIYNKSDWRPHIHIKDVCKAIECWLEYEGKNSCWNIIGENFRKSYLSTYLAAVCPNLMITYIENDNITRSYQVNGDKAAKELKYRPSYGVSDAIKEIYVAAPLFNYQITGRSHYRNA